MRIAADTHVHVYPGHDLSRLLRSLTAGLGRESPDLVLAFLTERHDCHAFDAWVTAPAEGTPSGMSLRPLAGGDACLLAQGPASCLFLPGRQVVAQERIEILALATRDAVPDGLPAADTVTRILAGGGVPVVAWAPGKWFFARGKVVQALLDRFTPGELLLGDTSLRPTIWPEPILMRRARRRGFRVVAGSDPLPFAGDETMAGTYGSRADVAFDMDDPLASARRLLRDPALGLMGRRGGPVKTGLRLFRHART